MPEMVWENLHRKLPLNQKENNSAKFNLFSRERHREIERQRDRETERERQTERQRQRNRERERERERGRGRETERQRQRQRELGHQRTLLCQRRTFCVKAFALCQSALLGSLVTYYS